MIRINRLLLIAAATMTSLLAYAVEGWGVITDRGVAVPLDNIECLIATDYQPEFSMLMTDGNVIHDILKLSITRMEVPGGDGISDALTGDAVIISKESITLSCPAGDRDAVISNASGQQIGRYALTADDNKIDISAFPPGVYVLTVNGHSLKFMKR